MPKLTTIRRLNQIALVAAMTGCAGAPVADANSEEGATIDLFGVRAARERPPPPVRGPKGLRWPSGYRFPGRHGRQTLQPARNGAFMVDVDALGDGCPDGSWNADISPDGEALTVTFSAYELNLPPQEKSMAKNCNIEIALRSPKGMMYSAMTFFFGGYVFLDSNGMKANQTARYKFHGGLPVESEGRGAFVGPVDKEYMFQDDVGARTSRRWSGCARRGELRIATAIKVQNTADLSGSGYINVASINGNATLTVQLAWQPCSEGAADGGVQP